MALETPTNSSLIMDRGIPLGNSEDIDQRRALHVKIKNKNSEPIPVATVPVQLNPSVLNITSPATPNTEFPITLPTGTAQFRLKSRKLTRMKLAYVLGETVTNYYTLPPGSDFYESFVGSLGMIYLSCDKASQDIELICYA